MTVILVAVGLAAVVSFIFTAEDREPAAYREDGMYCRCDECKQRFLEKLKRIPGQEFI